jgi:hypothetical protein
LGPQSWGVVVSADELVEQFIDLSASMPVLPNNRKLRSLPSFVAFHAEISSIIGPSWNMLSNRMRRGDVVGDMMCTLCWVIVRISRSPQLGLCGEVAVVGRA